MHVAIAIVSYRSHKEVEACLAALQNCDHADFEVVICENGGREAFDRLASAALSAGPGRRIQYIMAERNLGYAGGVNRCLEATPNADAWWVLNPDTRPHANALSELVRRLARGDCEAVGCTIRLPDARIQSYGGQWRRQFARAVSLGYGSPADQPVDEADVEARQNYLNGAAMLVSRRFVEVAGLMREDYFLYCEEVEWCLRARSAGLRLGFAPQAHVEHDHGATTGNTTSVRGRSALSVYLDERNKILVTRDRFPRWLLPASAAALLLLILRFGRARAWPQLSQALRGWTAGLRGERGAPSTL